MIFSTVLSLVAALQVAQVPSSYVPPRPSPDSILAKVNGVPIKATDIEKLLWDWRGYEVMQDLISFQLIHDQAAKAKVSVTPSDVQKEYEKFAAEQKKNLPPGQDFESALRQQHQPKSRLYMQIESNLLLTKIVDTNFDPKKFVKISTLVFKPKSESATDLADAVGKAQDAYNRISKGESWDAVMGSSNQDQVLIQNKGVLGWRNMDAFPALTQSELKAGKVGTITKPVQTMNGIQFFQVLGIGADAKGGDLVELKALYEQSAKQTFIQNMQKTAKIERYYGETTKPKTK